MERWQDTTPKEILDKMIIKKTDSLYEINHRPSFKDTFAKLVISTSERSVCLFYDVGAAIFKDQHILCTGYNGPASGDVHCTKVGCARIVDGEIKSGTGLCRGSHAELNAIGNAAKCGINITGARIMTSWRPCFACAKQIVNAGLKEVLYLLDYKDDPNVDGYLRKLGINIVKYESEYLTRWINKLNGEFIQKK